MIVSVAMMKLFIVIDNRIVEAWLRSSVVERLSVEEDVAGSSPVEVASLRMFAGVSNRRRYAMILMPIWRNWKARLSPKEKVAGSSPVVGTMMDSAAAPSIMGSGVWNCYDPLWDSWNSGDSDTGSTPVRGLCAPLTERPMYNGHAEHPLVV